jgi:acyl-coenzyme A synthetase/AMP-(fatty) acid ligase/pimeloyl-ACP methyl ester carboxylesterase
LVTTGVSDLRSAPATLPPLGLAELDPKWSRLVTVPGLDLKGRTFHVLDNAEPEPDITLLCVHGNPSWSYLWRDLLAEPPAGARVIAIDHLDMGYSERTGTTRRLEQRIDDLSALTDQLDIDGPVVTVAHDWGGPISLGWAQRHRDQLIGMVLSNTAVHQPPDDAAPTIIRIARSGPLLETVAVKTSTFVRGAIEMSRRRPDAGVRDAFLAPYDSAERRAAVGDFVADIPLEPDHPSASALDEVAAGLEDLADVPALLLWGSSDPVFSDRYLHDLEQRLPRAETHRFAGARHYVPEEVDLAEAVSAWVGQLTDEPEVTSEEVERAPLWAYLERRAGDDDVAVAEMAEGGSGRQITFAELAADVDRVASGLQQSGVRSGDRVALLVPPGVDLSICLYACWKMGAVGVFVDAGLGVRGMGRALQSAAPDYLIGIPRALAAARVMGWPGRRIAVGTPSDATRRAQGIWTSLDELRRLGDGQPMPSQPGPDDLAVVVFTSGATGPAKGVRYRHRQAQAQRDALMAVYDIQPTDRLVAAFAPFALYGPAMGISSVVPDMEITAPGTLDAPALAEAAKAIGATLVFASPAALVNVCDTAHEMSSLQRAALHRVRLLMSAGAPVPHRLLARANRLMPDAEAHTPYGMTEVLPVADISLADIIEAGDGPGVCVGPPIDGVTALIDPLDPLGQPIGEPTAAPGMTGEVLIRAAHVKDGYDRLWLTQFRSAQPAGFHRSGDVGRFDEAGRLWIEGRLVHVIRTDKGPVTPVAIEHAVQTVDGVDLAAAVGVGPEGAQQVVVVVATSPGVRRPRLADTSLADRVRGAAAAEVAAVLEVPALPVDRRHNSKINRTRVAEWAAGVLGGGRLGRL